MLQFLGDLFFGVHLEILQLQVTNKIRNKIRNKIMSTQCCGSFFPPLGLKK